MTSDTAISRSVLSDQVKDRLLGAILDGRFPPGSRIVETRAAREFGTSQAPVREALRDLEAVGVVEITPFHGARVRHPTTSELLEAFVVRSELESLGVRLAVPNLSQADLDQLQSDFDQMRDAAARNDIHSEAAADARFHGRLLKIAANSTLEQVWKRLEPFSRTYITLMAGADRRRIAELHGPVLRALKARDAAAATVALRRHYVDIESMLRASWDVGTPAGTDPAGTHNGSVAATSRRHRRGDRPAAHAATK